MKCRKHPTEEAVAQCSNCGAYICEKCAELTENMRDTYGTLCVDCYRDLIHSAISVTDEEITTNKKDIKKLWIFYAIGVIFLIPSIIFFATTGDFAGIAMAICSICLASFFPIKEGIKKGKEAQEEKEAREGITYKVDYEGNIKRDTGFIGKAIYVVFYAVTGIITTPIYGVKKQKYLKECELRMTGFKEILADCDSLDE